jgi:hypothetical protein
VAFATDLARLEMLAEFKVPVHVPESGVAHLIAEQPSVNLFDNCPRERHDVLLAAERNRRSVR